MSPRAEDVKVRVTFPVDLTGYCFHSHEVFEPVETEGIIYVAFVAKMRGAELQTIAMTRAAAVKLRDDLTLLIELS